MKKIPVIDLFAGPGGLGEGFSKYENENNSPFQIKLSVEKDKFAHKTLELRSFYHQFVYCNEEIPDEYYSFVRGEITRDQLFEQFPEKADTAKKQSLCEELGVADEIEIDDSIKEALDGEKDWVLIGGPPCQAYSLAGRSRVGGIDKKDHRVYLYEEYLRIIAFHKPAVFVMENVKGLLSAEINGERIFDKIKKDLANPDSIFPKSKSPEYRIYSLVKKLDGENSNGQPIYRNNRDFLINAEKFGIPQKRHRIILLGIRENITISDINPLKLKPEINLKDVIGDLPAIRSVISRKRTGYYFKDSKKRYSYEKIENSFDVWKSHLRSFQKELKISFNLNLSFKYNNGSKFISEKTLSKSVELSDWYNDSRIEGTCNHESRAHLLEDIKRYIFATNFMKENGSSPKLSDYPENLLPDHKNVNSGKFVDRFKVQNPDQPASTITSHISKDGHYFIHYDMNQCRSFTVREAARIQTFPDNYFFCGPRTEQFKQVGNAVPPLLAYQIAEIVFKIYED